uniref:Transcriptional regulator n=1 Tax=Heterorhabditis bacteriophora TaxID=37862 RepID=A0A1I7WGZ4_HETBA
MVGEHDKPQTLDVLEDVIKRYW